jgi:hypothetical protein
LASYAAERPLVLAISRGAVPTGAEIARALRGDLDVVLVRKLRAPFSPEFAVGAIDEGVLPQHRTEVLNLVMMRAARARQEHPLQQIMAVEKTAQGTLVTTTDTHLARSIAQALQEAFRGELSLKCRKAENLLRATWTR